MHHQTVLRKIPIFGSLGKVLSFPRVTTISRRKEGEFVCRDLDLRACRKDVVLDFSRPGKPTDNACIESFNGKFRAECLKRDWFLPLDDARLKMEDWRREYNEVQPHGAIGDKPPISLMNGSGASGPP